MQIAHLEGFIHVVRYRTLSAAAAALYISQPALTARLQALESEAGQELFTRTHGGMQLTQAGRDFLPIAERALASMREAERSLAASREAAMRFRAGAVSALVIAAGPALSRYVLPEVVRTFRQTYGDTHVTVRTGRSPEILEMVLHNQVHVGFTRALPDPDLDVLPIMDGEFVFVTGHDPKDAGPLSRETRELANLDFILLSRSSTYHELILSWFAEAGFVPSVAIEVDDIEAAKQMAKAGLGITLLPRITVSADLRDGTLREISVPDRLPPRRAFVAMRRRDSGPAMEPLTSLLRALIAYGEGLSKTVPHQ